MKAWFTSRTNWLGLAIITMGGFQEWIAGAPIPDEYQGFITLATGGAVLILRKLTTGPIGG